MSGLPEGASLTAEHGDAAEAREGYADAAWKIAYAMGVVSVGWVIDWLGPRRNFSININVGAAQSCSSGLATRSPVCP